MLAVGNNNANTTYSGAIRNGTSNNAGVITKIGTGTLTFTNTNSYTGANECDFRRLWFINPMPQPPPPDWSSTVAQRPG